jgi:hypothetical protein
MAFISIMAFVSIWLSFRCFRFDHGFRFGFDFVLVMDFVSMFRFRFETKKRIRILKVLVCSYTVKIVSAQAISKWEYKRCFK